MSEPATAQQWICTSCGYIYDPEEGDPDGGIPAGTAFEDIPDTYWENGWDGSGEVLGLMSLDAHRTWARMGNYRPDPLVEGTNPCGETSLRDRDNCLLSALAVSTAQAQQATTTTTGSGGRSLDVTADNGIEWNKALDQGGLLLGENVHIDIEIEAMAVADQTQAGR